VLPVRALDAPFDVLSCAGFVMDCLQN